MRGKKAKLIRAVAAASRQNTIHETRAKWRQAGFFRRLAAAFLGVLCVLLVVAPVGAQTAPIPRDAYRYQRELIGNARAVWGLSAPVAVLAAQVHQESGWRPDARSAFAAGLAQFTPDTADWISARYASELGANQPLNPSWALRALARYDRHLYGGQLPAASECDRWAFTLAAYNGGAGWISRDRKMAAAAGADAARWWANVERYSPRAAWAIKENRGYPRRILLTIQPRYLAWGVGVECRDEA